MFSTISCMGWMLINFRNIGYLETSLTGNKSNIKYVVANFLSQVLFVFLFFWGMVMYANKVETKKNKN